jgi:hypothetical protein
VKKYLALLLIAPAFVACGTTPGAQEIQDCESGGNNAVGCEVTIQYNGRPLNCVSWSGSHGEVGLTCDFVQYWNTGGTR